MFYIFKRYSSIFRCQGKLRKCLNTTCWMVALLEDFLALRGLKQSGMKAELVARAFGVHELNAPKKFFQEEIYVNVKQEYSGRLTRNGIKSLGYQMKCRPIILNTIPKCKRKFGQVVLIMVIS